jgi:hypothetical protein
MKIAESFVEHASSTLDSPKLASDVGFALD